MEALWAPWRMEFIGKKGESECIFCTKPRPNDDAVLRENLVLARGQHAFVILNKYPYSSGHLLVVPFVHTTSLTQIAGATATEIHDTIARAVEILGREYRAEGFNIGVNLGKAGGAGIEGHVHYHVVPRWAGDVNFMPVIAEIKSMPEHLLATYDRLHPHFRRK
ncbi:MAG: HIT family protein [Planctomycetota bacterium]